MSKNLIKIALPYSLAKDEVSGNWVFLNREYLPIGFNTKFKVEPSMFPISHPIIRLREKTLLELSCPGSSIERDDKGKVTRVFLYNDRNDPCKSPELLAAYLKRLGKLAKCKTVNPWGVSV